jgi:N-acylneuraminate cytidylyltransferase/CMP-N,N'-diacetyllegionaminic acid synthase
MKNKIIAIIPARGGSKGLPRKNIKPLAGRPLIYYTIYEALKSNYLDRIIVSTEDEEIAKISKDCGAELPFMRPKELAMDNTPTLPVLQHAIHYLEEKENYYPDIIVLLEPTSPLRNNKDIDSAIKKFIESRYNTVVTVCKVDYPPHWVYKLEGGKLKPFIKNGKKITRRQDAPDLYRLNGAIYVIKRDLIMIENKILCDNMDGVIMPLEKSIDIDSELDFFIAEKLMKEKR